MKKKYRVYVWLIHSREWYRKGFVGELKDDALQYIASAPAGEYKIEEIFVNEKED